MSSFGERLLAILADHQYRQILEGFLIYLFLITPLELFIHEMGHLYFQLKYGIATRYVSIGLGRYFSFKIRGVIIFIGIPYLYGSSMCVGEGPEWDRESNNPRSFSYTGRHPRERFVIAVAGVGLTVAVSIIALAGLTSLFWLIGAEMKIVAYTVFACLWTNEASALLLPYKLFGIPTDSWQAIKALHDWRNWNSKNKKTP